MTDVRKIIDGARQHDEASVLVFGHRIGVTNVGNCLSDSQAGLLEKGVISLFGAFFSDGLSTSEVDGMINTSQV